VTLSSRADLPAWVVEIPSPSQGVWNLGPLPIRGYAFSILAGIVVAVWWTQRRIVARGGTANQVLDISAWAVPFGIVGGRIYHVITTPQPYFGPGGNPWNAVRIWEGGLGIWGAIALGAVGAWIGCRRHGLPLAVFADAMAPGYLVAQAMGRVGNWFNNEIYGPPTDLPWGLRIYEWDQAAGHAVLDAAGNPIVKGIFHPTFLYEALWCLLAAFVLVQVERRHSFRPGQVFAAFVVMGYPLGRFFVELIRTDDANQILGLRVNTWTSALVFLFGLWLYRRCGRAPEQPAAAALQGTGPADSLGASGDVTADVSAVPGPDPGGASRPSSRHLE